MDGKLVSSWYNLHTSVPQSYVQPPESRPCNAVHVLSTNNQKIPVIDLGGHDRDDIIRNIIKASEEYGFFQVQILHLPLFFFYFSTTHASRKKLK
jgi:salicylic acid 3-hydroxylase